MLEVVPPPPTCFGSSDASNTGMGGVFWGSDGHPHIWRHQWLSKIPARLVSFQNPTGDRNINEIYLAFHYALLNLVDHRARLLSAIAFFCDIFATL